MAVEAGSEELMAEPAVTIVVVPRERFEVALTSLDSIYENTEMPFELVYVDGRSPRRITRGISAAAEHHGFRHLRSNRYLSPNQARNLGLAQVTTPYVVFVDNDLVVTPGWLTTLLSSAEETGAWAVGPLYYEGDPVDEVIHMAGGDLLLEGEHGRRRFTTNHRMQGVRRADLAQPLERGPCGFVEFHCVLMRTDVFDRIGPLDEALLSTREHLDLCLRIARAGGEVWFEPSSVVTYTTPPPVALTDVPYFWLRWSESWNRASLEHFCDKYGIDPDYAQRLSIMRRRRRIVFLPVRRAARRTLGPRGEQAVTSILHGAERRLNRAFVRARVTSGDIAATAVSGSRT
jgi:GT2 family glycosyltransferase